MKKGIIFMAVLLSLLPFGLTAQAGGDLPPIPLTTEKIRIAGDANDDGGVDVRDVTAAMRFLAGGWGVKIDERNADVNGDNTVDLRDATILRRYLAGWQNVTLQ